MGANLCTHRHPDPTPTDHCLVKNGKSRPTSMLLVELLKPKCLKFDERKGKKKRGTENYAQKSSEMSPSTLEECLLNSPSFNPVSPGQFNHCRHSLLNSPSSFNPASPGQFNHGRHSPKVCPVSSMAGIEAIEDGGMDNLSRSQSGKRVSFRLPEADVYIYDQHEDTCEDVSPWKNKESDV